MDAAYTDEDHKVSLDNLDSLVEDLLKEDSSLFSQEMESLVRLIEDSNNGASAPGALPAPRPPVESLFALGPPPQQPSPENSNGSHPPAPQSARNDSSSTRTRKRPREKDFFSWTRHRLTPDLRLEPPDAAGPTIIDVSLTKPFLKDDHGEFFWFKTWLLPEMMVQLGPAAPKGGVLTLSALILHGGRPAETVSLRGDTLAPVVTGSARFSGIMFESTSFNCSGALFHLAVSYKSTDGGVLDTWISEGIRVLSKRKRGSLGAASERESEGRPSSQKTPADGGFEDALLQDWADGAIGMDEQGNVRARRLEVTCSRSGDLSDGVSNLEPLWTAMPAWLPRFCCMDGTRGFGMTISSVSTEQLIAAARDPSGVAASNLKVCWCSKNLDESLGVKMRKVVLGCPLMDAARLFDKHAVGALVDGLRSIAMRVALREVEATANMGAGGSGAPGQASAGRDAAGRPPILQRFAVHLGVLHFRESSQGSLPEVEMDTVLNYNPRTRRLTLCGHVQTSGKPMLTKGAAQGSYYRTVCDDSVDIFKRVDDLGYVVYCSAASCALFGIEPWEQVGAATGEYMHPEDHALLGKAFNQPVEGPLLINSVERAADWENRIWPTTHGHSDSSDGTDGISPAATSRIRGVVRHATATDYRWIDFVATFKYSKGKVRAVTLQGRPSLVEKRLFWDRRTGKSREPDNITV